MSYQSYEVEGVLEGGMSNRQIALMAAAKAVGNASYAFTVVDWAREFLAFLEEE